MNTAQTKSLAELPIDEPLVLDGGLATQLERQGEDLSSSLWSAATLRSNPGAIRAAHAAFFEAGAQVATTATYQLTPMSLARAGAAASEFRPLVRAAVDAASSARDAAGHGWVVGSIGPYGASLANGAEYTGEYGLGQGAPALRALREHHREGIEALLDAGVDALACETIPTLLEVEALVAEMVALHVQVPVWFSLTPAPGGLRTRTGEALSQVAALVSELPTTWALGVNCCPPEDVAPSLRALALSAPALSALALSAPAPREHGIRALAYPNSGESWDAAARAWRGDAAWDDDVVAQWRDLGATVIGGCCRVFPEQIVAIRAALPAPE